MKNLNRSYIIALALVAIVIIISQYLVQRSISSSKEDSRIINISGRQRMLSQKISKVSLSLYLAGNQKQFDKAKNELNSAVNTWTESHNGLQYGSEKLEMLNIKNSPEVIELFQSVSPYYQKMKGAADALVSIEYAYRDKKVMATHVNQILKNEAKFLKLMNDITFQYDDEAKAKVTTLSKTEYVLLLIGLGLLVLEALFIFRPVFSRIKSYTEELIEKEQSLNIALENERLEREQVTYLSMQAQTVFENVEEGVFLLDKDNIISDQHSKSLQKIFEIEEVGGRNFIQLMRPRLIQRDLEALEMFIKHLYNVEIDEEVLQQLNPIEQVEIFTDEKLGVIRSQFIQATFARIMAGDDIKNVLVTIRDVTESVLLQREVQDAEEKNKKDAVQLVSILKIQPSTLQQYLKNVRKKLKEISVRYENNSSTENMRSLMNYTFNTIHNLKGNAQLIDLELMVDNFQEVEEIIVGLKQKHKLQGNDFLKILFQVDEADKMAENMLQMLNRIAEIKTQITREDDLEETNERLVDSLKQGLERMAQENDKSADLDFDDESSTIPEHYKLPVRDVLIQLMRNSLVHGVEDEDDRLAKGKGMTAKLSVKLEDTSDGGLRLIYKDDGAGLDIEKVKEKAISKEIHTAEELSAMSDENIMNIIFENGFSTLNTKGKYGGMGQGLSLVKSIVNENGGDLKVISDKDKFFQITMELPVKKVEQTSSILSEN